MLVPMSLKQIIMCASGLQSYWFRMRGMEAPPTWDCVGPCLGHLDQHRSQGSSLLPWSEPVLSTHALSTHAYCHAIVLHEVNTTDAIVRLGEVCMEAIEAAPRVGLGCGERYWFGMPCRACLQGFW